MGGQGTGAAPAPACRSAASAGALTGCQPSRHGSPRIRSAEVQHATRKASGGEGEAGGPEGGVRPAQVAAPAETTQRVGLCSLRGCHRSGAGLWRRVWAAQAGAAKASAGSRIIGGQADGIGYGTAARTDGSLGLAQAAQRDHAASESQAERASESEPLARLDRAASDGGDDGTGDGDGRIAGCLEQADGQSAPRRAEQVEQREYAGGPAQRLVEPKEDVGAHDHAPRARKVEQRRDRSASGPAEGHRGLAAGAVRQPARHKVARRLGEAKRNQKRTRAGGALRLEAAASGGHESLRQLQGAHGPAHCRHQEGQQRRLRPRPPNRHLAGCRRAGSASLLRGRHSHRRGRVRAAGGRPARWGVCRLKDDVPRGVGVSLVRGALHADMWLVACGLWPSCSIEM
eukprot:scaffold18810_cov118-Isochrysis_galbana.AAC.5